MDDVHAFLNEHKLCIAWQIAADLLIDALLDARARDNYFIPALVLERLEQLT